MSEEPTWIKVEDAARMCSRTVRGFRDWVYRWNKTQEDPKRRVRRLKGRVHLNDLRRALELAKLKR